ncbi:DUF5906 domain-containing protein [Methylorubrum suomiense]
MWGDKFGPAQLVAKLLNFAGELSEHQQIDSAKFKQIVSGEVIDAQDKNKPLFTFRPRAAHWFASNHLPARATARTGSPAAGCSCTSPGPSRRTSARSTSTTSSSSPKSARLSRPGRCSTWSGCARRTSRSRSRPRRSSCARPWRTS